MTNRQNLIATTAICLALAGVGCSSDEPDASGATESAASQAQAATTAVEEAADAVEEAVADAADAAEEAVGDAMKSAEEAVEEVAGAVAPAAAEGECSLSIEVGDTISYSVRELSVPSSCGQVTVTLTHTGKLPKAAMGHNWVLTTTDNVEAVGLGGMNAGIDNNYVSQDDSNVIAATSLVGGGESTSVTFDLSKLDPAGSYSYVCTFPGHWAVMRGTFTITS